MPGLKEAAVIVAGRVLDSEPQNEYVDGRPTDKVKGFKVIVSIGDGDGFAAVSVKTEDFYRLKVEAGGSVAWLVRYGAWSRNDNAQNSCSFVREVGPNDLDKVVSFSSVTA